MASTEIADKYHHPGDYQPEGFAIHEQLAKRGVRPEDIDIVILTHLHWDHCYHLRKFSKAKVYAHRKEYEFAKAPIPLYYKSYEYPALGLTPQFDGVPFELVDGDAQITDGISVYPSPGHSPGHQTVVVNTEAGQYHLCGTLSTPRKISWPSLRSTTTVTPPARYQDVVASWKSIEDLKSAPRTPSSCWEVMTTPWMSFISKGRPSARRNNPVRRTGDAVPGCGVHGYLAQYILRSFAKFWKKEVGIMSKTIAVVASLDSKSKEVANARDLIQRAGHKALLIDLSVRHEPSLPPDVSSKEVLAADWLDLGGNPEATSPSGSS